MYISRKSQTITFSTLLTLGASIPVYAEAAPKFLHTAGTPLTTAALPISPLRQSIDALPAPAQANALSKLSTLNISDYDIPYLRADRDGAIYIEDHFQTGFRSPPTLRATRVSPEFENISAAQAFSLHSKPGASRVIYLDFDGHTITNTSWNAQFGSATYNALPYSIDSNYNSFSSTELSNIAEIWRRVAEDYAPFNVDVTTEEPAQFTNNVNRTLITRNTDAQNGPMPASHAGGVAYLGVWGSSSFASYYSPAFVYYNQLGNSANIAEAATHEIGHNLGLSHDGSSSAAYYSGQGTGNIAWGAIMGVGYGRQVTQWSKGEYAGANNQEDDTQIISGHLPQRSDDHGNNAGNATALEIASNGDVTATTPINDPDNNNPANKGIIESRNDVDFFSFSTAGGNVTIQATPAWETANTRGSNLDIELRLYDSAQKQIASANPATDTNAQISRNLAEGTYYVSVRGVGSQYYSDYASLGQYFLNGSIPAGDGGGGNGNQDTTPDAFNFTDKTNVAKNTVIESNAIQVSGINAPAIIRVDNGEYSINGKAYTSAQGTVENGASVKVRHTSSANDKTTVSTTLHIGDVSDTFSSKTVQGQTGGNDNKPDRMVFPMQKNVAVNTSVESAAVTISGIDTTVAITVIRGEYSINGGAYTAAKGTVNNGDVVKLRHTSSSKGNKAVKTTLRVGKGKAVFKSKTAKGGSNLDKNPDRFTFTAVTDAAKRTVVESNVITISGINTAAPISVKRGQYSINGGAYTKTKGTVNNGDIVQVRHTTHRRGGKNVKTTLKIGKISAQFKSTTAR